MFKLYFQKTATPKPDSKTFVRKLLSEHLGIDENELVINKTEYGKPYVEGFPGVYFNLSHTQGAMVCIISNQTVGVDVERIKDFNKRIAEKFFTENEQKYVFASESGQTVRFLEIWTRKEAYVKWLGTGMMVPFREFDVRQNNQICTVCIDEFIISICSGEIEDIVDIIVLPTNQ